MSNERYAIIRVYNELGYDTESYIVNSKSEMISIIRRLREAGYLPFHPQYRPGMAYEVQ